MSDTGPVSDTRTAAGSVVVTGTTAADEIAAAVIGVPGVAGLHGGMFGEIATYLPGRRVAGVRDADTRIEVHLTLYWQAPLRDTADAVRETVAALPAAAGRPVHIVVHDLVHEHPAPAAPMTPVAGQGTELP